MLYATDARTCAGHTRRQDGVLPQARRVLHPTFFFQKHNKVPFTNFPTQRPHQRTTLGLNSSDCLYGAFERMYVRYFSVRPSPLTFFSSFRHFSVRPNYQHGCIDRGKRSKYPIFAGEGSFCPYPYILERIPACHIIPTTGRCRNHSISFLILSHPRYK